MLAVDYAYEIKFDRQTKDFAIYVENELIGFASSYLEGQTKVDQFIFDKLTHGDHLTATQLDGGSPEAVNWSDRGDPPGDDPAPETGLGSSDDEGDDI